MGIAACCVSAASEQTIFFYNPESSVDNFATLKTEFDSYLSNQGGYSFQPFSDRSTFEKTLLDKRQGVYLLSNWHYTRLNEKVPLQPVLVGMSKGEVLQRKVLTARDADLEALRGATVAGAGAEEYLRALLKHMLGPERESLSDTVKLLVVPKDIDALLAVGFGMASAAISSESSLQKLSSINAKQYERLKSLASSEKSFLLIAAVPKRNSAEEMPLIKAMEEMNQAPNGEKKLKLLGLDGWKRIDALDASLSRQLK